MASARMPRPTANRLDAGANEAIIQAINIDNIPGTWTRKIVTLNVGSHRFPS
jgi:hypothetical protein